MRIIALFLFTQFTNCTNSPNCCIIKLDEVFYDILHESVESFYYKKVIRTNIRENLEYFEVLKITDPGVLLDLDKKKELLGHIIEIILKFEESVIDSPIFYKISAYIWHQLAHFIIPKDERRYQFIEILVKELEIYIIELLRKGRILCNKYIDQIILDNALDTGFQESIGIIPKTQSTDPGFFCTNSTEYRIIYSLNMDIGNFVNPHKILEDINYMIDIYNQGDELTHLNIIVHINIDIFMISYFHIELMSYPLKTDGKIEPFIQNFCSKIRLYVEKLNAVSIINYKPLQQKILYLQPKVVFLEESCNYSWAKLYLAQIISNSFGVKITIDNKLMGALDQYNSFLHNNVVTFFKNIFKNPNY